MKSYKSIYEYGTDEITIEKSRFIGYAAPVESEEKAQDFISDIKQQHKDATHNVFAYIIGENFHVQRYNDDGEPSGTAGIPILELLKKEELTNLVVVVTRYFGGIKLGAGGLVRAYIKGAKCALEKSKIVEMTPHTTLRIRIDYTLYGKVENELMNLNYHTENIVYDEAVNLDIICKSENTEKLLELLKDITNANLEYSVLEEKHMATVDGNLII